MCTDDTHSIAVSPSLSFRNDFQSVTILPDQATSCTQALQTPSSSQRHLLPVLRPGSSSASSILAKALSLRGCGIHCPPNHTSLSFPRTSNIFFTCSDIGLSNEKKAPLVARNKTLASSLLKTCNQL